MFELRDKDTMKRLHMNDTVKPDFSGKRVKRRALVLRGTPWLVEAVAHEVLFDLTV
jgi:hypothetical protein